MASPRSGIFISYARSDGEELASGLQRRLRAEGLSLWRDLDRLEGGRDWWLQITAALDEVAFMVLVMTPAAMSSAVVRKEWSYARQRGVCVYPVKGTDDIEIETLPRWMRSVHFYDLEREWQKFVNDLNTRPDLPRVPFMVEDLPLEFVPRPAEYEQLVSRLLDRARGEPVAITTAIRAAGGFGKTVLARALCHDEDVQNAFDDGILWVTLGESPGDLTGRVEDLIYLLSGQRPGFAGLEAATALFVELLADRDILLVIDDLWDIAHLKPFIQGGPNCARVITTRVLDALPANTHRVDVDAMRQSEAVALLGFGLPSGFDNQLAALAALLGEWPLLLKLANAALRDRVQGSGQSVTDAIAYVNRALAKRGVTFFDARDPVARHQAVTSTVELSIERLNHAERERFMELAVFPEDVTIPLATLEKLWRRTGALDEFDTEALCDRLSHLSLILLFEPTQRYIRIHDVIRWFLLNRLGGRLRERQDDLLEAHRPPSGDWADLPLSEVYLWDHLAEHLIAAERGAELVATVLDGRYLAAKSFARNALAVERDLLAAEREATSNATVVQLTRSFVQSSHLLNRCSSLDEVRTTLYSRIRHAVGLEAVVERLASALSPGHLRALHPLPDLPHAALIRTLSSGTSTLWGCTVSPDGTFVVSAGYDGVVIAWNTATATERFTVKAHTSWARRVRVSPNGAFIVSASFDRRLRLWNAATGAFLRELVGHTDGVTDCAVTPDSQLIVSTSLDATILIWDAATGAIVRRLSADWKDERGGWLVRGLASGHEASVWACAISADGRYLLSASADQTLKLWRLDSGEELRTFSGHTAAVQACAFSPDGRLVASGGADGTVRVWEIESGAQRFEFHAGGGAVNACAFLPDSTTIVFGCYDGTVRTREVIGAPRRRVYSGHTDIVNDCAVGPGGAFLVSASMDATLKMWSTTASLPPPRSDTRPVWVGACAVAREGDLVVSGASDTQLKVWSASRGRVRQRLIGHTSSVRGCAFSPGMDRIVSASADKSLRVWAVDSGEELAALLGHRDWVNSCDVSHDGLLIVSGASDKTLRVWDAVTYGRRIALVAHRDSVNACRFSPDGVAIASASDDGTVKVWQVAALREAWEAPPAVDVRSTVEESERRLKPVLLLGHEGSVNDCAFSPDGSVVVSASSDRSIRIWDASTGAMRRTIAAHRREVTGCAISRDGAFIASVSNDRTIKVWDTPTGQCVSTLHVDGALDQCAWLADNRRLVAVGAGGVYFLERST